MNHSALASLRNRSTMVHTGGDPGPALTRLAVAAGSAIVGFSAAGYLLYTHKPMWAIGAAFAGLSPIAYYKYLDAKNQAETDQAAAALTTGK